MQVFNWTSTQKVMLEIMDTLPTDKWHDEGMVLDWVESAAEKIGLEVQYEHAVCFRPILDHKFEFPKGLVYIDMIAYKEDSAVTESEIADLKAAINSTPELSDNFYNGFLASALRDTYRPMRLSSNSFGGAYHLDNSINLDTSSEHEYWVTPHGFAGTSIKEGSVVMAFYRYPLDDCEDFMIPDDPDYITALKDYALMRFWEGEMNRQETGAERLFDRYSAKWDHMRRMVPGKFQNLTSNDEFENFRQMKDRLTSNKRSYYGFFGNESTEQLQSSMGRVPSSTYRISYV